MSATPASPASASSPTAASRCCRSATSATCRSTSPAVPPAMATATSRYRHCAARRLNLAPHVGAAQRSATRRPMHATTLPSPRGVTASATTGRCSPSNGIASKASARVVAPNDPLAVLPAMARRHTACAMRPPISLCRCGGQADPNNIVPLGTINSWTPLHGIRPHRRSAPPGAASGSPFPPLRIAPLLLALAAGGCAVGPDFRAPAAPPADALVAVPAATVSAPVPTGDAQRFLSDQPVPAQWWRSFGNAELDRRVERALANSPNVDSAEAALRQAAEGIRGARGAAGRGWLRCHPRTACRRPGGHLAVHRPPCHRPHRLHARPVRRRAPRHRGPVRARRPGRRASPGHLSQPRRQRRHHECPRSLAARADRRHRGNRRGLRRTACAGRPPVRDRRQVAGRRAVARSEGATAQLPPLRKALRRPARFCRLSR